MSADKEYVCTLDNASIKKAKDELNESPEDRLAAVQALREWIEAQPHIMCPKLGTNFLLMMLRGTKFSQLKAREKLESQLLLKVNYPKYFLDLDPWHPTVKTLLDTGYMTILPKRTPDGCLIIIQKLGLLGKILGPLKISMVDLNRFSHIFFSKFITDEMTQVNGMVFLADFSGLSATAMTKLMNPEQGKLHKEMQKAMAGRFKAFHYYRAGVMLETLMAFWRPFMQKKWLDRIKVHETMESLYKDIPKECLPIEFLPDDYTGPNVGHLDDINKAHAEFVLSKENREFQLYHSSKAFWVDTSKRPEEKVTEHFRKLNVE